MIISVVNQKGGTGKTTVATNLAACFAGEGREVLVIDADPQQSSLDWRADRPEDQSPVQAVGLPARNLHQEIAPFRRKYDVILIDGCVFRAKVATDSGRNLPPIPVEGCH